MNGEWAEIVAPALLAARAAARWILVSLLVGPLSVVAILIQARPDRRPLDPERELPIEAVGDLGDRHAGVLRRVEALVDPRRHQDVHPRLPGDVAEQERCPTDAEVRPVDEQVDALATQDVHAGHARLGHLRPVHVHVRGIGRPQEVDEQVLVRQRERDVRASDGPGDRVQDDAVDRPWAGRAPRRVRPQARRGRSRNQSACQPRGQKGSRPPDQELAPVELARMILACHPRLLTDNR